MEPLFEEGSEMESTRASSAFVDSMVAAPITEDPQNVPNMNTLIFCGYCISFVKFLAF